MNYFMVLIRTFQVILASGWNRNVRHQFVSCWGAVCGKVATKVPKIITLVGFIARAYLNSVSQLHAGKSFFK
jgi:hypothetical protein